MKRAGLNPTLAYQTGGGGSSGGGMASPVNVGAAASQGLQQGMSAAGTAVSSALAARRQAQEIRNMKAQEELLDAQKGALAGTVEESRIKQKIYSGPMGEIMWMLQNNQMGGAARILGRIFGSSARSVRRFSSVFPKGGLGKPMRVRVPNTTRQRMRTVKRGNRKAGKELLKKFQTNRTIP